MYVSYIHFSLYCKSWCGLLIILSKSSLDCLKLYFKFNLTFFSNHCKAEVYQNVNPLSSKGYFKTNELSKTRVMIHPLSKQCRNSHEATFYLTGQNLNQYRKCFVIKSVFSNLYIESFGIYIQVSQCQCVMKQNFHIMLFK